MGTILALLKLGADGEIVDARIRKFRDGELEECVACGKQTDVRCDTPVDERDFYIEGAGQICPGCYRRIYGPSSSEETRTRLWFEEIGIKF